jgi:cell division protease FtsH
MGGATFALPEKDRMFYTKKYCMAQMQVCFGGRISEELFCDDIDSGAQSDIRQATSMAREMILIWGMGEELGPINYAGDQTNMYYPNPSPEYSEKTSEIIDKEIKKLIDQAYAAAKELIGANAEKLESIAQALLKYETLDAEDVQVILDGGVLDKPTVSDLLALEEKKTQQGEPDEKTQPSQAQNEEVSGDDQEPPDG